MRMPRGTRGHVRKALPAVILTLCIFLLSSLPCPAQQPVSGQGAISPVITVDHRPNAKSQEAKHYVVLVSVDGFRYDYARKYDADRLLALGRQGAIAPEGMLPVYPTFTFPNHYTLVTGLYPEHHGIVANRFYDPARRQFYSLSDASSEDGSWYGGVPLWSLAEHQGMRSACFFWPGSEAEIDGERPSYYLKFDPKIPDRKRIDQVIAWLRLPPAQRPHFLTLYFGGVDYAGHEFGPESKQTAEAVRHVDRLIGELWKRLEGLGLPLDLIVVSDHGMATVEGNWINLDQYADLSGFITAGTLLYAKSDAAAEHAYQQLKIKSDAFAVYRRSELPAELHAGANARIGDPVVVATGPYAIRVHPPKDGSEDAPPKGMHGYNPELVPSMRAFFLAAGPDIRPGMKVRPFEDVNVYPLIAHLLGLHAPRTDGNLNILSGILRDSR